MESVICMDGLLLLSYQSERLFPRFRYLPGTTRQKDVYRVGKIATLCNQADSLYCL